MAKISDIEAGIVEGYSDVDLEREVCAFTVRRSSVLVWNLQDAWFTDSAYQECIRAMRDLRTQVSKAALLRELMEREVAPAEDVVGELYGADVDGLSEVAIRLSAEKLEKLYRMREFVRSSMRVVRDVSKGRYNIDKHFARVQSLSRSGVAEGLGGHYIESLPERMEIVRERGEQSQDGDEREQVPTGIGTLDLWLGGGLLPGEFGVIAGRSSVGKSATLQAFALAAWRNNMNVIYATGEMNKIELELRVDSSLTGIESERMRTGDLEESDYSLWADILAAEEDHRQGNILQVVEYPQRFTVADIESAMDRVGERTGKKVQAVFVDYLNIMGTARGNTWNGHQSWEAQGDVVWELKELCAERNIALWTAGQVKSEAYESRRLHMEDLKYSGVIYENTPIIIGIVRTGQDEDHRLEIQILKLRGAAVPTKAVVLHPRLSVMRIHEEVVGTGSLPTEPQIATIPRQRSRKRRLGGNEGTGV